METRIRPQEGRVCERKLEEERGKGYSCSDGELTEVGTLLGRHFASYNLAHRPCPSLCVCIPAVRARGQQRLNSIRDGSQRWGAAGISRPVSGFPSFNLTLHRPSPIILRDNSYTRPAEAEQYLG